ncbi:MAG: radical SAM protein [Clostridia bacterium]|nr:radical SAM protein [Clostridia bacterium]
MRTNQYLRNLNRVEFIITYACSGRCKHCSQGDHPDVGEVIDAEAAVKALREAAQNYSIKSIMTFGGEPLIYADRVYPIHKAASELNIPKRQLITNGFFSRDEENIRRAAHSLADCGVNDLLLSVDAFHEESIPMSYVKLFARALVEEGVPTRLSPAWLVSAEADNPYNTRTRELLFEFTSLGLPVGEGNVIFPKGKALKYLAEYIDPNAKDPYEDDPADIRSISIEPDNTLMGKSILDNDIMKILSRYTPC